MKIWLRPVVAFLEFFKTVTIVRFWFKDDQDVDMDLFCGVDIWVFDLTNTIYCFSSVRVYSISNCSCSSLGIISSVCQIFSTYSVNCHLRGCVNSFLLSFDLEYSRSIFYRGEKSMRYLMWRNILSDRHYQFNTTHFGIDYPHKFSDGGFLQCMG